MWPGSMPRAAVSERLRRARVTALATLWVVGLAVAATAPALFGNRSLGPEAFLDADLLYTHGKPQPAPRIFDATRIYYDLPRDFVTADGFRHGRFDLWNPLVGFGMPLWAEGGGLFFPPKIPFYVAPSRRTYDVATALRLVLAGLGAYALARWRGLAPLPALAAGSLYELSGAMVGTLQLGELAPPCLLPWVLLGAEVIAQRKHVAAAAAAGLALGATANSGHPMFVVVVFVGFGAAIVGHMIAAWRQPRAALAIGGLATVAVVIGLALGAPAFLPMWETTSIGRLYKSGGMYQLQFHWFRAQIRQALPFALFAPATLVSLNLPHSLAAPTIGLFGFAVAVAGLLKRGLDAALLAVGVVGVGMTLAPPVLGLIGRLPLLQYVYPMYAFSLVVLPLTQAAGRGVAVLSERRERWPILAALALVLVGASSLFLVQDVAPGSLLAVPMRKNFLASLGDWAGRLRLALPLLSVSLIAIALAVAMRTRVGNRCALAAVVLAPVELLLFVAPTAWFPDTEVLAAPPSPALRFLRRNLDADRYRMLASPHTLGLPVTPALFGLSDVRGSAHVPAERYVRYLEAIVPKAAWYIWQSPNDVVRHPLLDLAAVRYVAVPRVAGSAPEQQLQGDPELRLVHHDERVAIYENAAALPRARIVRSAVAVRDAGDAFRQLVDVAAADSHAAPAGLADVVFVEPSPDGEPVPEAPARPSSGPDSVQLVATHDPDRVELEATLATPGWVVLADAFHPGWVATIDGVATPIHPANLLFRGVFVPAGTHRIAFRYAPLSFRLGLALAVVGLIASACLLVRQRGRDRAASP
jgi:hypothetical protein